MVDIGWYNGWSPEERKAATPIQKAAIASRELARPTTCSICDCRGAGDWRADDAVWLHSEDYANPLAVYPVCRRCHRLLHRRFDDPAPWLELVTRHGSSGELWFEQLSMDPMSRYRPFAESYPAGLAAAKSPGAA